MTLLALQYEKNIRKEKILRLASGFLIVLNVVILAGIAFMMPSYFLLVLSRDDILRGLEAIKEGFEQKSFKNADDDIKNVNILISDYETAQKKKMEFAPILSKISSVTPSEIKISYLHFRKINDGTFSLLIRGNSSRRGAFLDYLSALKALPEVENVMSPISNLLKDRDLDFSLEVKFKKEIYSYAVEK